VADRGGLAEVAMRNLGKAALLDSLANWVFTRIELPPVDAPWRPAMRARPAAARGMLAAHP
jgi:hypothetical protein